MNEFYPYGLLAAIFEDEQIRRMRNLGVKSANLIAQALHRLDIHNSAWDKFLISRKNNLQKFLNSTIWVYGNYSDEKETLLGYNM